MRIAAANQLSAARQNRGIHGLVDPSAVPHMRTIGKQTNYVVRERLIPFGRPVDALQKISLVAILCDQLRDGCGARGVQCLVGIEHQNPGAPGMRDGAISGS